MSDSLVSVVVPVYNVENYLSKCIESIISQTYTELEIILVDDGSSDKSGTICDIYAKNDSRITVIHKKNGGLSDARNKALEIISGSYVIFVDSDDYIEVDYVAYLLELVERNEADISICNFKYVNENGNLLNRISDSRMQCVFDRREAIDKLLTGKEVNTSASMKMYKTELFDNVRYPIGKYYEDVSTTYKLILKADKIVYGDRALYVYLCRTGSITKQKFNSRHLDALDNIEEMCNSISAIYPDLSDKCKARVFSQYLSIYLMLRKANGDIHLQNELFNKMKTMNFSSFRGKKVKMYYWLIRIGKKPFDLAIGFEELLQRKRKEVHQE